MCSRQMKVKKRRQISADLMNSPMILGTHILHQNTYLFCQRGKTLASGPHTCQVILL